MSYPSEDIASADNTTRSQSRSHSLDGTRSGDSSESRRESLLLSDEQYIVDYLGNSSGSDDGMSIEAQRITRRKKLEREKLQKLGLFTTFLIAAGIDERPGPSGPEILFGSYPKIMW